MSGFSESAEDKAKKRSGLKSMVLGGVLFVVFLVFLFVWTSREIVLDTVGDVHISQGENGIIRRIAKKAAKANDPSKCESIRRDVVVDDMILTPEIAQEWCRKVYAVETENVEYCLSLPESDCIIRIAKKTHNPEICELNPDYDAKGLDWCKTVSTPDENYCLRAAAKDPCYENVALYKKSEQLCRMIKSEYRQEKCVEKVR